MQGTAVAMEERENMIKRLNAGILGFLKRIKLRAAGATILGGFAGLSLTSNIIPSVMSYMGIIDSFSARWALGGYAVYSIMIWSMGGWAVQKIGHKGYGALTLGFVGLVSGMVFTGVAIGTQLNVLLIGGGAAMLYGGIGGMIIADALRNPPEDTDKADRPADKKGAKSAESVRLFRFFK